MRLFAVFLLVCGLFAQTAVRYTGQPGAVPLHIGDGTGSVTSVVIAGTANQITATGTCTITTTGTCTLSIPSAFVLPGTIDGLTITTTTGTFTLTNAKTFTVGNTVTINATDGSTIVFPDPSGVTTGHCAQINKSGTTLTFADAGAACGGSPISGATTNAFVAAASATTIQTPCTGCTLDSSGNALLLSLTTGLGGSVAGYSACAQGTATTAPTASVGFMCPASVTTKFMMTLPAAPITGLMLNTGTTDPSVISFVTAIPNGFTATTQAAGSNDTKIATDAYVDRLNCTTTVTTGTTATLSTCFTVNQEATAGAGVTYTLPTAESGLQRCIDSGWNGSAADTGVLTLAASASGQFLVFTDGTLSATGGNVTSGGAARDGACVYGIDSTHWMFLPHSGTWTKH